LQHLRFGVSEDVSHGLESIAFDESAFFDSVLEHIDVIAGTVFHLSVCNRTVENFAILKDAVANIAGNESRIPDFYVFKIAPIERAFVVDMLGCFFEIIFCGGGELDEPDPKKIELIEILILRELRNLVDGERFVFFFVWMEFFALFQERIVQVFPSDFLS